MHTQRGFRFDDASLIERGFTLVELLIVIVILGVLAGIVVFAVGNLTSSAANHACATEMQTFETAVQAYFANTPGATLTQGSSAPNSADGMATQLFNGGSGSLASATVSWYGDGSNFAAGGPASAQNYWSYAPGGTAGNAAGSVTPHGTCQ